MSSRTVNRAALAAIAGLSLVVFAFVAWGNAASSGDPAPAANKTWVAGDTMEIMHKQLGPGKSEQAAVVLSKNQIKFSNPQDLILSLSAECALWTNTATTGDDDAETKARVETWVTIDGLRVPVSPNDTAPDNTSADPDDQAGAGKVVLCNRATRMKTENIEMAGPVADADTEDDIIIRAYNRSRAAHAFNWAAIDVGRNYDTQGDNVVDVVVHARLVGEVEDQDTSDNISPLDDPTTPDNEEQDASPAALAAIGKRTLVIEPTRMAVRATTTNGETVGQQSALTSFRRMQRAKAR